MKLLTTKQNKDGTRTVTLRLDADEVSLVSINHSRHYRLGGQVDDIVASHVLTECIPVYWCSIEQKWVEA